MSSSESPTDVQGAIAAATAQFIAAFGRQDAAGCAQLYTELGATLPPNAEMARGREAIQAVWQELFDAGLTAFAVDSLEVENAGDWAYEMGRYRLYAGDDLADEGKYLLIWKREAGQWRIHRDIVNTSRPA
jgi:ketosteroid isomerase-like protein